MHTFAFIAPHIPQQQQQKKNIDRVQTHNYINYRCIQKKLINTCVQRHTTRTSQRSIICVVYT